MLYIKYEYPLGVLFKRETDSSKNSKHYPSLVCELLFVYSFNKIACAKNEILILMFFWMTW